MQQPLPSSFVSYTVENLTTESFATWRIQSICRQTAIHRIEITIKEFNSNILFLKLRIKHVQCPRNIILRRYKIKSYSEKIFSVDECLCCDWHSFPTHNNIHRCACFRFKTDRILNWLKYCLLSHVTYINQSQPIADPNFIRPQTQWNR